MMHSTDSLCNKKQAYVQEVPLSQKPYPIPFQTHAIFKQTYKLFLPKPVLECLADKIPLKTRSKRHFVPAPCSVKPLHNL